MHFVPLHSVLRSLAFHCFLGGGGSCRRQGKSAAPDGPAWWRWLVGSRCLLPPSNRLREDKRGGGWQAQIPAPGLPGAVFSKNPQRFGGSGGVGAFGAISSFAFRLRGRSCVRMAGTMVFKAAEPAFCPDGDYS